MEDDHGNKFVYLQPYIHQVGGHSSMLCLDENRVCKPVIERELLFYKSIPDELKPYAPNFLGIVEVNVLFDGEYMYLVALNGEESVKKNSQIGRLRLRRSGSVEVLPTKCQFEDDISNGKNGTTDMNPWVLKCHRDHLVTLVKAIHASKKPQNFLVLENLTCALRFPCILDLKMGTRQYDERDSLAKRQSKMFKVVNTTTGKLGLRVAGMQVYQVTTGRFLCRNKLYGRALTPAGFSVAMRQFLHDGVRLRTELLSPFIRKLEGLAGTLGEQNSLRLYTTSLLLIYEGDSTTILQNQDRLKEKRDSVIRSRGMSLDEELIDMDYECITRSTSAESITSLLEGVTEVRATRYHGRRRSSSCAGQPRSSSDMGLSDQAEEEPFTDVRVIDFAHSSHSSMAECGVYNGPDEGFLFGLDNIIAILKGIEREYRSEDEVIAV